MKKLLSGVLTLSMMLSLTVPVGAIEPGEDGPQTEYQVTITPEEREAIHAAVDELSGYIGDMVLGDEDLDPLTLVGGLATGSSYDSISHGRRAAGSIPTEYPFEVPNTEANRNEGDRKTAKLAWVEKLAKDLGFEVVVHRQDDKYVYVEIGDPDAPEMVMALSHLDSPTASISEEQLDRWVDYDGTQSDTAYHTPYVRDGWLYGAGVQDDSGPTLATLFAAKALMDSGVSFDRRIRIVMGAYEDSNPGVPTVEDTLDYMDIPYYTSNPSFYDNWAYKSLNREEIPIAAYTSDSRFPVVVGNSKASTPTVYMNLWDDTAKPFHLISAGANVTEREGDPTLKDIVHGSTSQIASKAVFELQASTEEGANEAFIASVKQAATERGWLPTAEGETAKVSAVYDTEKDAVVLTINTDVAMEMPTPQYGKNAVVWGMYLISEALGDQGITAEDMKLKQAADGITALFFQNYTEGEAYIGRYMGIPEDMLRNPDSGVANLTFALMGGIQGTYDLVSFYDPETGALEIPLYVRSMHTNAQDYNTAVDAVTEAWEERGFELLGGFSAFSDPTLYADHDNPLIDLQLASYLATMQSDPEAFADVYDLLSLSYPVGTTGGTLASNYTNKMTAFGAVIPGNERWWHSANERIKVDSIVEMTKMMADGMLEMARYSDAAGAQLMWADIPGLNSERAELDLLDITVGTYQDASADVAADLGDDFLLGATKFDIHMWKERGNSSFTQAAYDAGHGEGGVYLPLDDPDFLENTFVMPMRLEFKVERPDGVSNSGWNNFVRNGLDDLTFYIQKNGEAIPLTLSSGEDEDQFYSVRTTEEDPDSVYVAVNLAITDSAYDGVSTVVADSKTDLYKLNDEYLATHENPFPERGQIEERGFFLFGDGEKNAQFTSPEAIYVVADEDAFDSRSSGGGGGSSSSRPQQPDQPDQPSQDENMFNDVSSSAWYAEAVEYVYDNGLMTGVSGSSFAPNNTLTRAMVVQTLYAMAGKPEVSGSESFADVASNDWFADAVTWASANGIVNGYSAAQFAPGDPVTREQLALILYGYAQIRGYNTTQGGMSIREFSDYGAISDWALEAMDWAVNAGLLSGKGNGVLDPAGTATRAEVAQILMNFCENIAK